MSGRGADGASATRQATAQQRSTSTDEGADADAVLAACRLLVGISVRSMAVVEEQVSPTELRILTVVTSHRGMTLKALAEAVGLHMSRASRACDRLVERALLRRDEEPSDRRSLRLTTTPEGTALVRKVATARRAAIRPALRRMAPADRASLIRALDAFTAAGKEPAEAELWAMGWAT